MINSRRNFLRSLGGAALARAALLAGAERLFALDALAMTSAAADYKALVCIFLFGGNDANNMVIPIDGYDAYAAVRGVSGGIAIPLDMLLPVAPPTDADHRQFGLHPMLGELHQLWLGQRLAVVLNVGPLIRPLDKDEYLADPRVRPYQLFSHSDQQNEWQTAYANGPFPSGWAGRTADLAPDDASGFPTIASVSGATLFTAGRRTRPLVLPPAPRPLDRALQLKRVADRGDGSALRTLLEQDASDSAPTLVRTVARIGSQAIANSLSLTTDPVLGTVFPDTPLGNQLQQVAKLISVRDMIGLRRQVFFCSIGGFDTHNNQNPGGPMGANGQPGLLRQVSQAMSAFYSATVELGVASQVVTFTMSDFNRTFRPGGQGAATGTDHAWGAHHFVMGDAVLGGDFYGVYPTLALGGPDDTDTGANARGRWIPTLSVDQYAATLAAWFGVAAADLPIVFPNIGNFERTELGFIQPPATAVR